MTQLLASVRNLDEALTALAAGVDIIDLKAPEQGSLGALPPEEVQCIAARIAGRRPLSATVGDLPLYPDSIVDAVAAMASTGVDYVKIGFFPEGDALATVAALARLALPGARLVGVLFGDLEPDPSWPARLRAAGFAGAMLDTLDKSGGSLTRRCAPAFLQDFVDRTRAAGLFCGLAGSLAIDDIPELLTLQPDYLGFRGALCRDRCRTAGLQRDLVAAAGQAMRRGARRPGASGAFHGEPDWPRSPADRLAPTSEPTPQPTQSPA